MSATLSVTWIPIDGPSRLLTNVAVPSPATIAHFRSILSERTGVSASKILLTDLVLSRGLRFIYHVYADHDDLSEASEEENKLLAHEVSERLDNDSGVHTYENNLVRMCSIRNRLTFPIACSFVRGVTTGRMLYTRLYSVLRSRLRPGAERKLIRRHGFDFDRIESLFPVTADRIEGENPSFARIILKLTPSCYAIDVKKRSRRQRSPPRAAWSDEVLVPAEESPEETAREVALGGSGYGYSSPRNRRYYRFSLDIADAFKKYFLRN